jgi:uroporphyrin-III C-methyltransferase
MPKKLSIAILCGGMSSRMGQEKGLVMYQNKPFVQHLIDLVKSLTNDLFLVTSNTDYAPFGYPLQADIYPNKGPVGGIYTALNFAKNHEVLILSCDVPLLEISLLQRLILVSETNKNAICYASTLHHDHPLVGVYPKSVVKMFEIALQSNELKLMHVIEKLEIKKMKVEEEEVSQLQNINTKEDLNRMINNKERELILVGAGPGDADLITLKGVKAIQNAKVILYDALVNEELLEYAPHAKKIFVGKRLGCHAYTQDQINELIVAQVNTYGSTVRLKGGDSFVFGRGSEEIEYAQQFGIKISVIPGITSALAVPALQGISITKRGIAESFWVITGTTSHHELSNDVILASQSSATVVILMGMHKLDEIVSWYQKNRTDNLPVAIIQNGTTKEEKIVVSTINEIVEQVAINQMSSPAIIVIGQVVNHAVQLKEMLQERQILQKTN